MFIIYIYKLYYIVYFLKGAIPLIVESIATRKWLDIRDLIWIWFLFGSTAITCNYMYIAFDDWFGSDINIFTVSVKTFLSVFVYFVFFSGPLQAFGFHLQSLDYNIKEWITIKSLKAVFPRKFATNMITGIIIWLPVEIIIYLLPLPLQFPIMTCFNCIDGINHIFHEHCL